MMALFMTLWIVNSVSKADRENIVAALHGQSIFNGGGMAPLNKAGQAADSARCAEEKRHAQQAG